MSDHRCARCGWKYPTFHVCMDMNNLPPLSKGMRELLYGPPKKREKRVLGPMSEEHKQAVAEGQRKRWAETRKKRAASERLVVERYKAGDIGINGLREEFGMGRDRIMRILKEAREAGEITIRPRGKTLKQGAL